MIRSVAIFNLRGIREGRIDGMTAITVLVGPNSSGKSTVLDAIYISASEKPQNVVNLVVQRRSSLQNADRWFLHRRGGKESAGARIELQADRSPLRTVQVLKPPHAPFSPAFNAVTEYSGTNGDEQAPPESVVNTGSLQDIPEVLLLDPYGSGPKQPLHELYSRVTERGRQKEAKAILTDLIPGLQDVQILTQDNVPVVYLIFDNAALPVGLAGDGLRLLLHQTLELASPVGGVVLIEEPELHMHPAAIRQSTKAMIASMRRGIQIIVTTHSLDLIDALLANLRPDETENLSCYRLQLEGGELRSHRLTGSEVLLSRTQIEDDLR